MDVINLTKKWKVDFDKPLGPPGGFGQVYEGSCFSNPSSIVAIKRLSLSSDLTNKREMEMSERLVDQEYENVIRVFDYGFDEKTNAYYTVMERANYSLQQIVQEEETVPVDEVKAILSQITHGLIEVEDILHRDLKPGNVLFIDGKWKIADFGIAKFIEDFTSENTLRDCMTYHYASPEQISLNRLSHKSDIYSLGCIGYFLCTGNPPFFGVTKTELIRKHKSSTPPRLEIDSSKLSILLSRMLLKNPDMRPSLIDVLELLKSFPNSKEVEKESPLSQVSKKIIENKAHAESIRIEKEETHNMRLSMGDEAGHALYLISRHLYEKFKKASGELIQVNDLGVRAFVGNLPGFKVFLSMEENVLNIDFPLSSQPYELGLFKNSGWDVICGAVITVIQQKPNPYRWSSSLWFTDKGELDSYRWVEVSYFYNASKRRDEFPFAPMALTDIDDADKAAGKIMHCFSTATNPIPIDYELEEDFILRWEEIFAKACKGELSYPSHLPLNNN